MVDLSNKDEVLPRWQLLVCDVVGAAHFYERALGFRVGQLWGEPPGTVFVSREETLLVLRQTDDAPSTPLPFRVRSVEGTVPVAVSDVRALRRELVLRGATILNTGSSPEDSVIVEDCAGYRLEFRQSDQGLG